MPKTNEILLKLEGFHYYESLDLNMGYYHIGFELMYNNSAYGKILLQTSNNGNY